MRRLRTGRTVDGQQAGQVGKVDVAVYLTELSDKALAELKKLGFMKLLDSKAVKMVVGTVEAKQLETLAWLDVVRRVDLPSFVK